MTPRPVATIPDTFGSSVPPAPPPGDGDRPAAVTVHGVSKVYGSGRSAVAALDRIDLEVAAG